MKNVVLKLQNQMLEEKEWDILILACPVAHIWFLKSLPSRISLAIDMKLKKLKKFYILKVLLLLNQV